MAKPNVEKLKTALLAERARLLAGKSRLTEHGEAMGAELGEMGDYDVNHPADMGTEMFEREKDQALSENVTALLVQINEALAKISAGTYGLCDLCGQPIAAARITALPYVTLCVQCQSRLER